MDHIYIFFWLLNPQNKHPLAAAIAFILNVADVVF